MDFLQETFARLGCPCGSIDTPPQDFVCTCHLRPESERCWCGPCLHQRILTLEKKL